MSGSARMDETRFPAKSVARSINYIYFLAPLDRRMGRKASGAILGHCRHEVFCCFRFPRDRLGRPCGREPDVADEPDLDLRVLIGHPVRAFG